MTPFVTFCNLVLFHFLYPYRLFCTTGSTDCVPGRSVLASFAWSVFFKNKKTADNSFKQRSNERKFVL